MVGMPSKWPVLLLAWAFYFALVSAKMTYIVHMDKSAKPESLSDHLEWYASKVKSVADDDEEAVIYSYQNAFHGVVAWLTKESAQKLQQEDGVLSVLPDVKYELHTSRSPMFLGLDREDCMETWSQKVLDRDVIVGVLDTGIWPESQSFNGNGMGPVPTRWKGTCETGKSFRKNNCNRKIVGARIFYKGYEAEMGKVDGRSEYKSPRDQDGHGCWIMA